MTDDQVAILTDARLSIQARLMALWLSEHATDWRQVHTTEWAALVGRGPRGMPKRQQLAAWFAELEAYSLAKRRKGGHGNPSYFLFCGYPRGTTSQDGGTLVAPPSRMVVPSGHHQADTTTTTDDYYDYDHARAALEVVEGELFKGCRGALLDYLALRVPTRNQHGYVQRVAMALNGSDATWWTDERGDQLPDGRRTTMLAMALNELAGGSEVGEHFKHKPGNIGNLRSKVRHEARTWLGQQHDAKGAKDERPGRGSGSRASGAKASGAGRPPGQGAFKRG